MRCAAPPEPQKRSFGTNSVVAKAAEAAAFSALGRLEESARALREALSARPDLNAPFLNRAFPFEHEQDIKKLSEFMLATFVPDRSENANT